MRHLRLVFCALLALSLCLVVAVSLPSVAAAKGGKDKDQKVEGRLAAEAANADPNDELAVIVAGDDATAALAQHGGKEKGASLDLVGAVAASVKAKDLDQLAGDDGVAFVAADVPMQPEGGSLDPFKLATLYPKLDGAPVSWALKLDGSGVGVAVIDSGVKDVGNLGKQLVKVKVPGNDVNPDDGYGHGSLVAGVIAGQSGDSRYVGIAPDAKVYSINVNRPDGVHSSDVITALQWVFENAHANNIRVVNLSLQETVAGSYQQSLLDLAVERLWAAGILVVVAAGNGGAGAVDFAPANDPLVLTVGASDSADTLSTQDDKAASFSAFGVTHDGFAKPDLLAPGRHIVSGMSKGLLLAKSAPGQNKIADNYYSISGTSFSAPQAAGAAADLLEAHPDWSPDQLKWLLTQASQPVAGSSAGALSLSGALAYGGAIGLANQGVPALVCPPAGTTCVTAGAVGTVSSSWNSSSWNSSSWNSSSWNSSSWNSSSWNSSSWNSSSWKSSSWNSSSWNTSSWTSYSWS